MALILSLITVPVSAQSTPVSAKTIALPANLQFVQPVPGSDYDKEVLAPLRAAQAAQAKAEADAAAQAAAVEAARVAAYNAWLQTVAGRVRPFGTYGSNYAFGNCTWYVASRVQVPNSMGNATSWSYGLAAAGWSGGAPVVGAVGVSHNSYMGHVVLVEAVQGDQVQISEMNYNGFNVIDYRWTSISEFEYFH